ncbi:DegV family protein [Chloroflexota bacterium]
MATKFKLITDSSSDIPAELVGRYDITIVPNVVNIGNKSYLDDGKEITREDFYEQMPAMSELPKTAACPLGLTRELVAAKAAEADHLILVAVSPKLSSIYNNFRLAAEEFSPGRYTLIDSGQTTMGEGFQVIQAAEMAEEGASLDAIVAALDSLRKRTQIFAVLNTLENLRKSGRVGWATATAGRLLQLKPMIELSQGDVSSIGNIRTFKRAAAKLLETGLSYGPLDRLAVMHTNNPEAAEKLRQGLASVYPLDKIPMMNVNPGLGVHVGAQALGIALTTKE